MFRRNDDVVFIADREPVRFQPLLDNRLYRVTQGDTLFNLADRFFTTLANAAQLWWIIADYQPEPISDPTKELVPGTLLIIPSVSTVRSLITTEVRRGLEAI